MLFFHSLLKFFTIWENIMFQTAQMGYIITIKGYNHPKTAVPLFCNTYFI